MKLANKSLIILLLISATFIFLCIQFLMSCGGSGSGSSIDDGVAENVVVLSDGTLAHQSWSNAILIDGNGNGDVEVLQADTGGHPDAYKFITHGWAGPGEIVTTHIYQDDQYDPVSQGAVVSLDFSYELLLAQAGLSQIIEYRPLIYQNGYLFTIDSPSDYVNIDQWEYCSFKNLTEKDFDLVSESGPTHPNFKSTASPLKFGVFARHFTTADNTRAETGIDNWRVSITPGEDSELSAYTTISVQTLAGTDGEVLYKGKIYREDFMVPNNSVVAVIKDDQAYLYHPALGDVELSSDTSRLAVGEFFHQLWRSETDRDSMVFQKSIKITEDNGTNANSKLLKTGIEVIRLSENKIKLINRTVRWTAVKIGENSKPIFLMPTETDYSMMGIPVHLGQLAKKLVRNGLEILGADTERTMGAVKTVEVDSPDVQIKSWGAWRRTTKKWYGYEGMDEHANAQATSHAKGTTTKDDLALANMLDDIDYNMASLEISSQLWNTIPSEEFDTLQTMYHEFWKNDYLDERLMEDHIRLPDDLKYKMFFESSSDIIDNFGQALIKWKGGPAGAVVGEVPYFFLDYYKYWCWRKQGGEQNVIDLMEYMPYDTIYLSEIPTPDPSDDLTKGDTICHLSETGASLTPQRRVNMTSYANFFCHDGISNDCDDEVDCQDNDCANDPLCNGCDAAEDCSDFIDNDCDGHVDCEDSDCSDNSACINCTDDDNDGYYAEIGCGTDIDCKDNNSQINPGIAENCSDGVDNDCDSLIDCDDTADCKDDPACICTDNDGDNYFVEPGCGTEIDCNDNNIAVNPGAAENCTDGIDNDCDDLVDCEDSEGCDTHSACEVPRIGGTFKGPYTTHVNGCIDSDINHTFSGTMTIKIITQNENAFSGTITGELSFTTESGTINGTFEEKINGPDGTEWFISGSTTHKAVGTGTQGSGTFFGTYYEEEDTMVITNPGQDTVGDTCSYTRSMTVQR